MVTSKTARARAQWVAQAMEEERKSLEQRRKLLGRLYDEVERYLRAIRAIRPLLQELAAFGIGRAEVKRMFSMSDRELMALYEGRGSRTTKTEDSPAAAPDMSDALDSVRHEEARMVEPSEDSYQLMTSEVGEVDSSPGAGPYDAPGIIGPAGPDEFQYGIGGEPHEVGDHERIAVGAA